VPQPSPIGPTLVRTRTPPDGMGSDVSVRELMAVREIAHAFLNAQRPEEVFQFALARISPLVGASFASVYLVDGASELMHLAAEHNWPERYKPWLGQMRVRVGLGPSGEAVSERRAIEVPDVFADAGLEDWQDVASELGFRSFVALPLLTARGVLGAVTFYFSDAGATGGAERRGLLRLVADQLAATAEKATLIEELRNANAALQEANVELERQYAAVLEARRVKDEFLANISHELRTPLTAVMGYVGLMQEGLSGPVSPEQARDLEAVQSASRHLLALIDDLLELTSLKQGSLPVTATTFDPRAPLRDAIEQLALDESRLTLTVKEPARPLVPMVSDRRKVTRILLILLRNAVKFTERGTLTASVESSARVRYLVSDTGVGIPAAARELIFEEFRQVDGSSTRRHGGPGLGLAIARRLARLLGGEVRLETSSVGGGSTFSLDLPLEYDPDASDTVSS
jgi:signal transduction histidine kinase